jgi:hypothetical protein
VTSGNAGNGVLNSSVVHSSGSGNVVTVTQQQ